MFSFGLTLSMRSFQFEQLIRKDDRLRRIMEAVTHLKIIKLMNWEETFDNQVDELRAKELASIRMFLTLQVCTQYTPTQCENLRIFTATQVLRSKGEFFLEINSALKRQRCQ